jgi:hypothetical protein
MAIELLICHQILMLKRFVDLLILESVSIIYATAVFCLKRRQA